MSFHGGCLSVHLNAQLSSVTMHHLHWRDYTSVNADANARHLQRQVALQQSPLMGLGTPLMMLSSSQTCLAW